MLRAVIVLAVVQNNTSNLINFGTLIVELKKLPLVADGNMSIRFSMGLSI